MIRPLALLLGLRYTRAKRRNHFISFISLASMLGIALGVSVLITVLSVMNGFDYQVRKTIFSVIPEVTVLTSKNISTQWPTLRQQLLNMPQVKAAAPFIRGQAILLHSGRVMGMLIRGVEPQVEKTISTIQQDMVRGTLNSLQPNQFNIVLGQDIANQLGVTVGDKINVLTPQASITLAGIFPRYKTFTISGIFHSKSGIQYDRMLAYINMADAAKLFLPGQRSTGLNIKLHSIYQTGEVTDQLMNNTNYFLVSNWTEQFGAYFKAIGMEKIILFVILFLIVAVAAFNLVSSLVMLVHDKRADIAILRTLGASPGTVMRAFVIQGAVVGFVGTMLGLIGGLLLALNITDLVNYIQRSLHIQLISSAVYIVNYLPSRINPLDVFYVCLIAFLMSLVATLYPAIIAFRTQPAEALRYE